MEKTPLTTIEGYIIRVSPYKDKDAIITVLTSLSLISFRAPSAMKSTSRLHMATLILAHGKFSLKKSGKYFSLVEVELDFYPHLESDYSRCVAFSYIQELAQKLLPKDNISFDNNRIFLYLDESVHALIENVDVYKTALFLTGGWLKELGYGFEVDECLICGRHDDIVAFSFIEGGFLCRQHQKEPALHGADLLKVARWSFRTDFEKWKTSEIPQAPAKEFFLALLEHIPFFLDINFKSLQLWKTL